jgi:hypothetical protein
MTIACARRSNSDLPTKSSSAFIRRLRAGGDKASSLAAAFADPSFATRKKASSERKGGNLRIIISSFCRTATKNF